MLNEQLANNIALEQQQIVAGEVVQGNAQPVVDPNAPSV